MMLQEHSGVHPIDRTPTVNKRRLLYPLKASLIFRSLTLDHLLHSYIQAKGFNLI